MTYLKWIVALLVLASPPSHARDVLNVAGDHQSAAFVLTGTVVPLPMGTKVEFISKPEGGVPKKIPFVSGFILGKLNNVLFIELTHKEAAQVALHRARGDVTFQKLSDPVAEEVRVRREYRDSGTAILLAPRMRRLTVKMQLDSETVSTWSPGETLTFYGAQETIRHTRADGKRMQETVYRDVDAMLRYATETEDGQYEVTVVADPRNAQHILRAELENRLTVNEASKPLGQGARDSRCYIMHRRGVERIDVEIPCTN